MKKIWSFAICASMLMLCACGQNASATSTNAAAEYQPAETQQIDLPAPATVETEAAPAISEDFDLPAPAEAEAAPAETEAAPAEAEAKTTANPGAVDWRSYLNGDVFDLTAYATALGYTWLPDPEWDGLAMYAIERNGIKYFYCYQSDIISIYWEDAGGNCWAIGGVTCAGVKTYRVQSQGQSETETSEGMLNTLTSSLYRLKTDEPLVEYLIFPEGGVDFPLIKCAGQASYYPNGLIKQREFGEIIESYAVQPWDGFNVVQTK